MVSRRNLLEKIRKIEERHEHHSIRKFTMGAASVLVGLTFMGTNTRPVKASKTRKDDVVLVETQSTENEATEQSIIQQYTTETENTDTQIQNSDVSVDPTTDSSTSESVDTHVATDTQNTDSVAQENVSSPTDNSNQEVTNEETASQTETKQPTYQESVDKVNDINNNVNKDLNEVVDEASKIDGVKVEKKDPNKINTTVGDIDKNADKIKEDNEKQIAEIEKQLADYKVKLDQYKSDLEKYNTELANYNKLKDEYVAKLKELGLWKEGDVDPSEISQDLVLGKEENTHVDITVSNNHNGSITQGTGTILKDENGNPLLMNHYIIKDTLSDDFLTVTYTGLENSTYAGKKISKIEVIYSDLTKSGNKKASIYFGKNPTDGFFYLNATGVTIELKMYDKDGKLITLKDNTAYVTVGSLNSNKGVNDKYVEKAEIINGAGHKGEGVALPESSVGVHKGEGQYGGDVLYADKNNELLYDKTITDAEKKLAISIWGKEIVNRYLNWDDSTDRSKEIFGAGLFKVSGNSIKIRFSNELGSAWATFSTTVPHLAFKGEKPTEPTKPEGITISWQPSELVLNKNSNVHIHYIDVHEEAKNGLTEFDHVNSGHGFELKDQLQSHTHLSIGDRYHNQLWAYADAGYILATDTHHPDAESGIVPEKDKHVYVYLKRDSETIHRDKVVNQTIHYVYEDGTTAAPDYVRNKENGRYLIFTQTGKRDKVTGEEIWDGNWTLTQTFEKVVSPIIEGYTADLLEVGPYDITVDNDNFDQNLDKEDTVIYKANPAQPTTPPDQPTDPTNPTTPQPTVPKTPDPEPTVPTQPTDPEVPTETPEIPEENETVIPHPEETPSEEKENETVIPKSQETKRDDSETTTVTPKDEKIETVTNVSTEETQNVEEVEESKEAALPQTGSKENDKAGAAGLIAATLGSLIGLAGADKKKRKKNN